MKKVLFTATVDSHILHFHLPYLQLFKDNGYEVHVATNGNEEIPYCDKKHVIPFERSPYKINNLKAIKQLKNIINEEKFDIIHTHTPMGSVVTRLASKKARKNGTRVIYTAHGFHFYKGAPLLNWILFYPVEKYLSKYTDTLITINDEDYQLAKKKFKKTNVEYVPGVGIDPQKFDIKMTDKEKTELRKELGLKKDDFVMICVGELNDNKNQTMQIEALKQLVQKYKNIKLLLVGEGNKKNFLKEKINEYNLEENVILLGYRKDVPKLLKISNLALSTSKREGLPVNVIEALTTGIPVIGTNCRGNRDLIEHSKNGYIIEIDNYKDLMQKIILVYNNKIKQVKINKKYELESTLKKIKKIYN